MLERLSDRTIRLLIERGKLVKGAAPFLRPAKGMVAVRMEGYRRGIGRSSDDEIQSFVVAAEKLQRGGA